MDLIEEAYGLEVADAMRAGTPQLVCECCGGGERLRGVPLIMADHADGGRAVDGSQGAPQRAICSWCFAIWYDGGPTNQEEIGKEHHRRKAAGKYPFSKACAVIEPDRERP